MSGARDPGGAVELLGNGGPLVLFDCRLGAPQDPPHQVRVGGFTQGTITLARCRFNHQLAPVVVQDDGPTPGARPTVELLGCPGFADTGPALPADTPDWMPAPRLRPSQRAAAATRIPSPATENEDSSEALQAALDALAQRGGGVLLLPPGLFVLRRPLQLPSGVALQGVGGRGGATVVGPGQTRGTLLAWAGDAEGPMLLLKDCTGARVSGLHFTTLGAPGGDPGPTTIRTMLDVRGGTDLWLEDLGAGWLAGDGGGAGAGVCETFLRIDGASAVTLRGAGLQQVAGQGVDVQQARDIELSALVVSDSRCAVRVGPAGEVAWLGGGAGNTGGRYPDASALWLAGGRVYAAGLEVQDNAPLRVLLGAGSATIAGSDFLFPAQGDRFVDLRGALLLVGSAIGTDTEAGGELRAATLVSLGGAVEGPATRFIGDPLVSRGNRAQDRAERWPRQVVQLAAK